MRASSIVTNEGVRLTGDLLNIGGKLDFTKIAVGSGAKPDVLPQEMKSLSSELYELSAFNVEREQNRLKISGILPEGAAYPLTITEFGLFAKDTDGKSVLYGIAPEYDRPRLFYGEYDSGVFELYFELSNALEVTISIPFTGYITLEEVIKNFAPKDHRHSATQIDESTGETTEQVQRRQDAKLELMFQNFGGLNLVWGFEDGELEVCNVLRGVVADETLSTGGGF